MQINVVFISHFAEIDLISDKISDETKILALSHLVEEHELGQKVLKQ